MNRCGNALKLQTESLLTKKFKEILSFAVLLKKKFLNKVEANHWNSKLEVKSTAIFEDTKRKFKNVTFCTFENVANLYFSETSFIFESCWANSLKSQRWKKLKPY